MTDRMRTTSHRFSRRVVLKTGAGLLAATGSGVLPVRAQTPAASMQIELPDTGAKLPTDDVTFSWSDSGDVKANFMRALFKAYHAKHPNITIDYRPAPFKDLQQSLTIGFQNGNAPDVFQLPGALPAAQVISEGWIAPIDDLIPDFEQWKAAFPPGSFFEGFNQFQGKTYSLPITKSSGYTTFLTYNRAYMQQAGYDPKAKPLTWDEFRAACKKITEQGAGKHYGIVFGGVDGSGYGNFVSRLAAMDGLGGEIDWHTGKYNYASDSYLAAIDLLLSLFSDKSVFPGSNSLKAPQARAQFPTGIAGIFLDGTYGPAQWIKSNPDFNFDVGSQPIPNPGKYTPVGWQWGVTGANCFWVFAKSKQPAIAGDLFHYLGTKEGNKAFLVLGGGGQPSIYPDVNQSAPIDPRSKWMFKTLDEQQRLEPSPVVRNPDVAQVLLEQRTITPSFAQVMQGLVVGQIKDARKAMQDVADRTEAELDRAIKAAQAKGAKVTRDDWVFPNWDPTKDYTEDDYKALK